jgi:hypothetical protein
VLGISIGWAQMHIMFSSNGNIILTFSLHVLIVALLLPGEDIWRFLGKLTDAQKSMIDDRFKWKVSVYWCFDPFSTFSALIMIFLVGTRDGKKEGRSPW